MPVQMSWLLKDRVIYTRMSGIITEEDIQNFVTSFRQYIQEGQPPLVHYISDSSQIEKIPMNLGTLNKFLRADRPDPKMGWIVVVTANRPLTFISSMLAQLGKSRFRTFKTMEEAITFLNGIDVTLPPLVAPTPSGETDTQP